MPLGDVWANAWGNSWNGYWKQSTVSPQDYTIRGGDDAPPIRQRREFSKPEKELIAEDIRKIYEQLPEQQKLEVKSDIVRFAEKLPPRKKPVPISNIDFSALANNLAAVQAILNAYEQQTLYILAQEERDIEMLLMGL